MLDIKAFISAIVFLSLLSSCRQKSEPEMARLSMNDREWTETMDLKKVSYRPSMNCLDIFVYLGWSSLIHPNMAHLFFVKPEERGVVTAEEEFAWEKMKGRVKGIEDYYYANYASKTQDPHEITTVYIRDKITVYANKPFYGEQTGENLASYFRYSGGSVLFKMTGPDYKVYDDQGNDQNCSLADYFSKGTIVPFMFSIQSTALPEEYFTDDDITLTFVFPVTVEHYWQYLLELYDNPDAEEQFSDMEMTLEVNLKDLQVWDPHS